jgi:hypothetical protein
MLKDMLIGTGLDGGHLAGATSMYQIDGEMDGKLLVIRCAGFWDEAEFAAYRVSVLRAASAARGWFDMLVDLRQFPAQGVTGGPEMEATIAELARLGMRHVALLTPSAVQRMQANRVGGGRAVFFEDEAEARAWLRRMRLAS